MPTPSLEQVQADPKFKALSPEAQKIVLSRLNAVGGGGGGAKKTVAKDEPRDPVSSALGAVGDTLGNVVVGAGKDLGNAAVSVGETMMPKAGSALDQAAGGTFGTYGPSAMRQAHEAIGQPEGIPQNIGAMASHLTRLALPAAVAGPMAAPAAVGAATGGLEYAEGGSPGESIVAGLTGGLGQKLMQMRAAKQGAEAFGDFANIHRSIAKERLPELQAEIDAARAKGAVPGHGKVPNRLLDELRDITRLLATDEGAQAAGSKVGEVAGPTVGAGVTNILQHPITKKLAYLAAGALGSKAAGKLGKMLLEP